MKIIKKILSIALIFVFVFSSSILTSAKAKNSDFKPDIDLSKIEYRDDGSIKYSVTNLEDFANHLGLEDNDIKDVNIIIFADNDEPAPSISTRGLGFYLNLISGPSEAYGTKHFAIAAAYNSSKNPVDKEVHISGTASNTYSRSLESGITIGSGELQAAISSTVGIDVTHSQTLTDVTIVNGMKPGSSVTVYAYPIYNGYYFDIMEFNLFGADKRIGFGNAHEVIGMYTVVR